MDPNPLNEGKVMREQKEGRRRLECHFAPFPQPTPAWKNPARITKTFVTMAPSTIEWPEYCPKY